MLGSVFVAGSEIMDVAKKCQAPLRASKQRCVPITQKEVFSYVLSSGSPVCLLGLEQLTITTGCSSPGCSAL